MSIYGNIRSMERKVRSSLAYSRWVARNKASACFKCGGASNLEVHHIVELYSIIAGFCKFYGDDEKSILAHVIAMHEDDHCENATLCDKCHAQRHPGRSSPDFRGPMRKENWTAYPRSVRLPLSHSTCSATSSSVGLVCFQVFLALGWYVLNGRMESRMVELNRRRLADMLGKSPGTSFNKSLDEALGTLSRLGIVLAHHRKGNDVELHLSPDYLSALGGNPWFMPVRELDAPSMCSLTLRKFLGTQSNRRSYRIGLDKLKAHLGMTIGDNWMAARAVEKACAGSHGVKVEIKKGMCSFSLPKKGSVPIHSLRSILLDSLESGK